MTDHTYSQQNTDGLRQALERMAARDPGLAWNDNLLLIQSAAQAAKDALVLLRSLPQPSEAGQSGATDELCVVGADLDRLRNAAQEACDLLAERKYGSPARSPGHNARLLLERALSLSVPASAPEGEAVAWRYKTHDGQFVYMASRLSDEQKANGYYRDEEDDFDLEDDAESGPFFWSDEIPLYAALPAPKAVGDERAHAAAIENLREAWAALAMIRETVETLAPSGAVTAAEHLDGPTFTHEADALVEGIIAIAASPDARAAVIEECGPYKGPMVIDASLLHALWCYGALNIVTGVVYSYGTHQTCLEDADRLLRDRNRALQPATPATGGQHG